MIKLSTDDIGQATRQPHGLALRGIDPMLRAALDKEAARLGLSLNALVLIILRRSLGLAEDAPLHHDLDSLAGAWSQDQAEEFARALQPFEEIDARLWVSDPDAA
jgi:hypothetical protein